MQFSAIVAFAFAGLAAAAPSAQINVESSHGGAGNGLINKTIEVPIGTVFTGSDALKEVSTLYLVAVSDADINTVVCTPHKNVEGTDAGGKPFTVNQPSYLSTNTVVVGSIVCKA
ncbi:hypothetical protein F5Y11DRAFT_279612 [Daldinia sp. FL1419]|nr:hypothetical protein F5Y11DRAFT_279612 [Daldinia sp. FL1419]